MARVPTGMNVGVSTGPWPVTIVPRRARELRSTALTWNGSCVVVLGVVIPAVVMPYAAADCSCPSRP